MSEISEALSGTDNNTTQSAKSKKSDRITTPRLAWSLSLVLSRASAKQSSGKRSVRYATERKIVRSTSRLPVASGNHDDRPPEGSACSRFDPGDKLRA